MMIYPANWSEAVRMWAYQTIRVPAAASSSPAMMKVRRSCHLSESGPQVKVWKRTFITIGPVANKVVSVTLKPR